MGVVGIGVAAAARACVSVWGVIAMRRIQIIMFQLIPFTITSNKKGQSYNAIIHAYKRIC